MVATCIAFSVTRPEARCENRAISSDFCEVHLAAPSMCLERYLYYKDDAACGTKKTNPNFTHIRCSTIKKTIAALDILELKAYIYDLKQRRERVRACLDRMEVFWDQCVHPSARNKKHADIRPEIQNEFDVCSTEIAAVDAQITAIKTAVKAEQRANARAIEASSSAIASTAAKQAQLASQHTQLASQHTQLVSKADVLNRTIDLVSKAEQDFAQLVGDSNNPQQIDADYVSQPLPASKKGKKKSKAKKKSTPTNAPPSSSSSHDPQFDLNATSRSVRETMVTQIMNTSFRPPFDNNPRLFRAYLLAAYLSLLQSGYPMSPVSSPDIVNVIQGITDDGSLRQLYSWTTTIDDTLLNEARAHVRNGAA